IFAALGAYLFVLLFYNGNVLFDRMTVYFIRRSKIWRSFLSYAMNLTSLVPILFGFYGFLIGFYKEWPEISIISLLFVLTFLFSSAILANRIHRSYNLLMFEKRKLEGILQATIPFLFALVGILIVLES